MATLEDEDDSYIDARATESSARDIELEGRIREELYYGCVDAAKEWLSEIDDRELASCMRRLIREYEAR